MGLAAVQIHVLIPALLLLGFMISPEQSVEKIFFLYSITLASLSESVGHMYVHLSLDFLFCSIGLGLYDNAILP